MMDEEQDRISNLSDDVLAHILSFLELRDAFKTMILSKRWEKVWTLTHSINLNNKSCVRRFDQRLSLDKEIRRRTTFINFINGVLFGDNMIFPVKAFTLSYYFGYADFIRHRHSPYLIKWVDAVSTNDLEKFDFSISIDCTFPVLNMPPTLFQCQNLVTLSLESINRVLICFDVLETACLLSLKYLRLVKVRFEEENTLKNLLSGCPVLEELYMEPGDTGFKSIPHFYFISPSLKILRWKREEGFRGYFVVKAPKLEHLHFVEHSMLGFSMSVSPSLVSVVMDIGSSFGHHGHISVKKLFQGISNAQKLEWSTHHTFMAKVELDNLPEFCNLTHLKIGSCQDLYFVSSIIQHSPHLKHLIFDKDHFISGPMTWSPPVQVPPCLVSHLETVEIIAPEGQTSYEIELILYLLHKGKVLKKMIVTPFSCMDLRKKLWESPKAGGCKIVFSDFPAGAELERQSFCGDRIYVCTPKKEEDLKPYITKGNHHAAAVVNTPKKEEKEATSVKDEPS
ncbi:hypothetical protein Gohar_014020 [Gossypium harknessii]|uniref:FBD domain-containing protein n=1 Tax=Gossypium harknessii TaxID=34285 RepID=A0A7J9H1Z6_9ROSI|nr:hypothetical protein [Gossypium harknessii]